MAHSQAEKGVFKAVKKDKTFYFRASLTYRGKHISLGSFDCESDAHAAYLEGTRLLSDSAVTLLSYQASSPLSFEKWVILLNFRDHSIYFGKPIYLGQKMFYYYLSQNLILKFDLDDLFYFSSHKIMCRGRHFFVADYGMQVNIANRFGIKNYAVQGRDYCFINGDPMDFRRVNIKILNTYHGVSEIQKGGQLLYAARIHIKGNYLIGRYATPLEAAIAYNKAIDLLKEKGYDRNYQPNYIDGLSPKTYAEVYSQVRLSHKLRSFDPFISPKSQQS